MFAVLYSDGMGRTGTFCAVMLCREHLLTEHMADVFNTVKTIRAQRPGMVENSVRKLPIVTSNVCVYDVMLLHYRNNTSSFTRH